MDKDSKKALTKVVVSGLLGGTAGGVVFSTLRTIGSQIPSKPAKIVWTVGSFVAGGVVSIQSGDLILDFICETEALITHVRTRVLKKSNEKEA